MTKPKTQIKEAMTNYKVQSANQALGTPLKIRGARGVMRVGVMEVTPYYPPYSKGEI